VGRYTRALANGVSDTLCSSSTKHHTIRNDARFVIRMHSVLLFPASMKWSRSQEMEQARPTAARRPSGSGFVPCLLSGTTFLQLACFTRVLDLLPSGVLSTARGKLNPSHSSFEDTFSVTNNDRNPPRTALAANMEPLRSPSPDQGIYSQCMRTGVRPHFPFFSTPE